MEPGSLNISEYLSVFMTFNIHIKFYIMLSVVVFEKGLYPMNEYLIGENLVGENFRRG